MIDVDLEKTVPGFSLAVAFRNAEGVTALFGRSGSGKSMTLGLIAGLARPDHGHVRIGDAMLVDTRARLAVPMHRRRVGLVFQDSQLFPHLSVRHNLLFGRWFAPRRDGAVGFDAVVETLGIGALLDRRPARLSGGERQRVAIGRALLAAPRLLLLDEPFAALDRQRKLEILPLIERLRDEFAIPIVFVSHALTEVVRLAATVVVMADGKVVASGDPANVLPTIREAGDERFGRTSIVATTVGETDHAYGLVALNHPAGKLWLAGTAGPRGRTVRAIIHATDVSLAPVLPGAPGPLGTLSIRSVLAGTIGGVETEGPLAAVEIALTGGGTLIAMVTRRAMDDLALGVGSPVHALVKTVALDEGAIAPD